MIDFFFGNYLMKFNNININYNYVKNRKLAAVIVATKPSFWLPLVIKNALFKIKECNLYFFGSNETIPIILSIWLPHLILSLTCLIWIININEN